MAGTDDEAPTHGLVERQFSGSDRNRPRVAGARLCVDLLGLCLHRLGHVPVSPSSVAQLPSCHGRPPRDPRNGQRAPLFDRSCSWVTGFAYAR